MVGQLVWPTVALFIIGFQLYRFRESGRSKFASLGLVFWAGALLILSCISIFERWVSGNELSIVAILTGFIAIILVIGSWVTTGIGYFETLRAENRRRGLNLAVWSTILNLGVFVVIGLVIVSRSGGVDSGRGDRAFGQAFYAEVPDLNFAVEIEEPGWIKIPHEKVNPALSLFVRNNRKQTGLMVIAEPLGMEMDDLSIFEAMIEGGAKGAMQNVKFSDFSDEVVAGRAVRQAKASAMLGIKKIEYVYHLFFENGVLYQVIVASEGPEGIEEGSAEVDELVGSFRILNDRFIPGLDDGDLVSSVEVPAYGISIPLNELGWIGGADFLEDSPHWVGGAGNLAGSVLGVMAIRDLLENESLEVIAFSFFHAMDWDLDTLDHELIRDVRLGELPALKYRFLSEIDGSIYQCELVVARSGSSGIGVIGSWLESENGTSVIKALESVVVDLDILELGSERGALSEDVEADMLNAAGLAHYNNSRYGKAMVYFKLAYEKDPEMRVALHNVAQAATYMGEHDAAIDFIESRIDAEKDSLEVRIAFVQLLANDSRWDDAVSLALPIYSEGYVNDDLLLTLINGLIEMDDYDHAIELSKAAAEATPGLKRETWVVSVLRLSGDLESAELLLNELMEKNGPDALVLEEQANLLIARGEFENALDLIDLWVEEHGESYDAYDVKITAQVELNWLGDAKQTVSLALEAFPGDENFLESQRWLLAQVGEDDLNLINDPIEPVELLPQVAELMKLAVNREGRDQWDQADAVYDYRVTSFAFNFGQPLRRTDRSRVTLQQRSAMEDFSTLEFEFDRSYETFYVNYIRVLDADGEMVWEHKRDSFYVSENSDETLATDSVSVYAPVGSLSVGSVLEWEATWESDESSFPFREILFASGKPRKERIVSVSGDIEQVSFESTAVDSIEMKSKESLAWHLSDADGFIWENGMPELSSFIPTLRLSAAGETWESLVNDYYAKIVDKLLPDEKIQQLAVSEGLSGETPIETVKRVVGMAQDRVVYKALEFGSRGIIPMDARTTWENSYGDCKDQTVLLIQMLEGAGIEAFPFLISTDSAFVSEMPSLDQFNHMILYIPALGEQPFVDVVDTHFDTGYGPPAGLGGRFGVRIDPDGGEILRVPDYPHSIEEPVALVEVTVEKHEESPDTLVFSEKLSLNGYYAIWTRREFIDLGPDHYEWEVKDLVSRYLPDEATIKTGNISNLNDLSKPFELSIDYEMPLSESENLDFRPAWEQYYFDHEPSSRRTKPYEIYYPFSLRSSVLVQDPNLELGFAESLESRRSLNSEVVELQFETATEETELAQSGAFGKNSFSLGWPSLVLSSDQYQRFYDDIDAAEKLGVRSIHWKK